MKKKLLSFILFFFLGFFTHALVFPDFLANGFTDVSQIVIPEPSKPPTEATNQQLTIIEYDGKKFSRNNIRVGFTRYIQIINTSPDKLMWLTSNHPDLGTVRGYAEAEAVKTQMNEKGTFVVQDKNNPNEKLVITVK